jgi:hypothetical protein
MAQACTIATITMAGHKAFFSETAYWWLDYGHRADGIIVEAEKRLGLRYSG